MGDDTGMIDGTEFKLVPGESDRFGLIRKIADGDGYNHDEDQDQYGALCQYITDFV